MSRNDRPGHHPASGSSRPAPHLEISDFGRKQ